MARWEPGGRERLEQAALDLFAERGYEQATVSEIAERAGLKERSFYRYFPDKREVLFAGDELEGHLTAAIQAMPDDLSPLDTLLGALPSAGEVLRPRAFVRRRAQVIGANAALAERELIKLAGLSRSLSSTLAARGVDENTAELCAGIGMAVLRQAARRWIQSDQAFTAVLDDTTRTLAGLLDVGRTAGQA